MVVENGCVNLQQQSSTRVVGEKEILTLRYMRFIPIYSAYISNLGCRFFAYFEDIQSEQTI